MGHRRYHGWHPFPDVEVPLEEDDSTYWRGQIHDFHAGLVYERLLDMHNNHCTHIELELSPALKDQLDDLIMGVGKYAPSNVMEHRYRFIIPDDRIAAKGLSEPESESEGEGESEPESESETRKNLSQNQKRKAKANQRRNPSPNQKRKANQKRNLSPNQKRKAKANQKRNLS